MRRSMIGIGSMALLGAISFAPVFAQQGGGQQGQQGQGQGQRQGQQGQGQGQGYGQDRQGQQGGGMDRQGQQGGMDRQGQQGGMDRQGQFGQSGQTGQIRVGQQAPALNLFDLKGQVFVLEFINPTDEKWTKLHESGQLKQTYERYKEQGIVWLAICPFESTAAKSGVGQQGGVGQQQGGVGQQPGQQPGMRQGQTGEIQGIAKMDRNQLIQTVRRLDLDFPVLYDEGCKIVKQFGINQLPHVLIVDAEGKVAYASPLGAQSGQMAGSSAGIDQFERALGTAVQTQQSGSLPAGSPRQGQGQNQGMDRQGQGQGQSTTPDQGVDREKKDRERIERERNQNVPR